MDACRSYRYLIFALDEFAIKSEHISEIMRYFFDSLLILVGFVQKEQLASFRRKRHVSFSFFLYEVAEPEIMIRLPFLSD